MTTQAEFYREFLDNRDNFDPAQFDVPLNREAFGRVVLNRFMNQNPHSTFSVFQS